MVNEPTPNQERVVKMTVENLRKGKRIIKGEILKKSGYAKSTTTHPKVIYESDGVKQGLKPIVDELKELRNRTIKALKTKNLKNEKVQELNNLLKNLNHDIQLLEGEPTERFDIPIDPKKLEALNKILDA